MAVDRHFVLLALALAFGAGQVDLTAVTAWALVELRSREARLELWTVIGVVAAVYSALHG